MRRYHCIIPFTGAQHEVHVPPAASTGQFTVDSLLRQLPTPEYQQQSGVPFRIDVLTTGSPSFGPSRGLGSDDLLPEPSDESCQLILLFDVKYLDRFAQVKIDSANALISHQNRQTVAFKHLLSPLQHYLDQIRGELDRATKFVRAIHDELGRSVGVMAKSLETLRGMPLVNESDVTLADRVGDVNPTIQAGWDELNMAGQNLRLVETKLQDVEKKYAEEVRREPSATEPTSSGWEALRRDVQTRIATLKTLLKATDAGRKDIVRAVEAVKAVRDGVLIKVLMINSLPEAYNAGVNLAKRRLTFNKASTRVRQMLAVEHAALCDAITEFVQHYGPRFPTNLIPGIHSKPALPIFEDSVADFIRAAPAVQSYDEDPASDLLVSLGLLRRIESSPSQTSVSDESSSRFMKDQVQELKKQLDDAQALLEAQRTQMNRDLANLQRAYEALSADHRTALEQVARLREEHEVAREQLSELKNRLEFEHHATAAATEEATDLRRFIDTLRAEKDKLQAEISELRAAVSKNRPSTPPPAVGAAVGVGGVQVDPSAILRTTERARADAARDAETARAEAKALAAELSAERDKATRKQEEWENIKSALVSRIEELEAVAAASAASPKRSTVSGLPAPPEIATFFAACKSGGLSDQGIRDELYQRLTSHGPLNFTADGNRLTAKWGEWTVLAEPNAKNTAILKRAFGSYGTLLIISEVTSQGVISGPVAWL